MAPVVVPNDKFSKSILSSVPSKDQTPSFSLRGKQAVPEIRSDLKNYVVRELEIHKKLNHQL